MVIVNLTPHVLNIFLPSQVERKGRMLRRVKGVEAVMSLPSVGFARSQEVIEELRSLDCGGVLLPVVRKRFAVAVDGLPAPKEGTVFIVSFLTAQAVPDREDVYFPGEALRDDDGNIIGCVGLARV